MKKHNLSQFFKTKGFYVVLFIGVLAIAGVTVFGINAKSNSDEKKKLADLNSPIELTKDDELAELPEGETNTDEVSNPEEVEDAKTYTNDELLEYDVYDGDDASVENAEDTTQTQETQETQTAETTTGETTEQTADETAAEEESVSVMQPSAQDGYDFTNESTMTWPVKGNVIMNYSMDSLIHFATLGEWKCNPAIVISSEVGTEVVAATDGVVTSVDKDDETGTTVTTNVGNGYEVVYGQLNDCTLAVGDTVTEGTTIGTVAEPTMYYSVEGANVYLKVLKDGEPVNPMLFLAGEE